MSKIYLGDTQFGGSGNFVDGSVGVNKTEE